MFNLIARFQNNHAPGTLGASCFPREIEVTVAFGPKAECATKDDALTVAYQRAFAKLGREVGFIGATAVAA